MEGEDRFDAATIPYQEHDDPLSGWLSPLTNHSQPQGIPLILLLFPDSLDSLTCFQY